MNTYNKKSLQKNKAVGIKYDAQQKSDAPKVVVKGDGDLASQILTLAQEHGLLIHEDENLVEILSQIEVGQSIPENLYHVIAELIAFSFLLQGKFPEQWDNVHKHIDFKA